MAMSNWNVAIDIAETMDDVYTAGLCSLPWYQGNVRYTNVPVMFLISRPFGPGL